MQKARVGMWAVSGVLAVAAVVWWRHGGLDTAEVAARAGVIPVARVPFVPSMQGTQPDGDLQPLRVAGIQTSPAAYAQLVRMFDYYLSAIGEASTEAIQQRIVHELDLAMSPAQAQEAKRLLGLYLAFKRALVELEQDPALVGNGVQAIRQRMLAVQQLRERYFTADEVQGMFGFEDRYDADALARLSIDQDAHLSAAQKKSQLAALDAALSEPLRADRNANLALLNTQQQALDMRAKGATDDDVYRMRSQAFGTQAASRLAEVDREEQAWQSRIAAYQAARHAILSAEGTRSEDQHQQALVQLQQSHFSEDERRRLVAYEK